MRPSSLGGGRILRRTLSVCPSVCQSVPLSLPSVTSRHLANYNDTHVLFGTRWGPHIVRPSRPHKFLFWVFRAFCCRPIVQFVFRYFLLSCLLVAVVWLSVPVQMRNPKNSSPKSPIMCDGDVNPWSPTHLYCKISKSRVLGSHKFQSGVLIRNLSTHPQTNRLILRCVLKVSTAMRWSSANHVIWDAFKDPSIPTGRDVTTTYINYQENLFEVNEECWTRQSFCRFILKSSGNQTP